MRRADLSAAVLLLAIATYILYETASYPDSLVPDSPGPAFFPRLLAGLLIVCATILAFQAVRSRNGESPPPRAWSQSARSGVTLGLVGLFLVVVEQTDFFLLLAVLVAAVMALMGERRVATLVLAPAGFVAFVYVVFFRLFGVPFPTVL